jgi:hypothetical protein
MAFRKMAVAGLVGLALSLASAPSTAQTPDDKIPVYRLDVREVPDIPEGKAALVAGDAGPTPHRFFVENLHMLIPISVTVRAVNPADVINVKILKGKWDSPLREGNTSDGKAANFKFRTHGEFQISVDSQKPASPYKMVVWLGPDINPMLAPVIVPRSKYQGDLGESKWMWWAGGAAAVLAILAIVFLRRKQAS